MGALLSIFGLANSISKATAGGNLLKPDAIGSVCWGYI